MDHRLSLTGIILLFTSLTACDRAPVYIEAEWVRVMLEKYIKNPEMLMCPTADEPTEENKVNENLTRRDTRLTKFTQELRLSLAQASPAQR